MSGSSEGACLRKFGRACFGSSKGQDIQRSTCIVEEAFYFFFYIVVNPTPLPLEGHAYPV